MDYRNFHINLRKKWQTSLRFQLITPFVIGIICLIIFLVGYTYTSAYRAVDNAMLNISNARTEHTVDTIIMLMKSLQYRTQELVIDPDVLNVLLKHNQRKSSIKNTENWRVYTTKTSQRLATITEGYRYFRDILLLDSNAVCIASSNESYLGIDYSKEEYVRYASRGQYYLGNFSVGKVSKNFTSYLSAPIDVGGKMDGILVIISDFPRIIQYHPQNDSLAGKISTSMLAPDGIYMAHKDMNIMGNKKLDYRSVYKQLVLVGQRGGPVKYIQDGRQYVGFAQVEPNTQWVIITSGLKNEVFSNAYRTGSIVFTISFIFFFIISVMVIRHASKIIKNLLSLIRYAKNVSEGNLELSLETSTRTDELGVLHNALDNLVATLQEMFHARQEADRMKDEFLANMSHEIRTPLNAVIGMAHLAEQENADPEKRKLHLNRIKVAAQSLLGIINDILDISKVEAGKMSIERNVFELKGMAEETLGIHQESAREKGLSLSFECDAKTHSHYIGDVLRIRQVLNNLLSNAIKFTEEGQITLACWDAPVENDRKKTRVYFSVSDTGIGIPPKIISKLFHPFTQADASVTRKFGGTGLGLAISRRLVQLMDGEIWLDSVVNEGSKFTFYITLPIAQDSDLKKIHISQQKEGDLDAIPAPSNQRILLAEDNEINQIIFKELLVSFGVEVVAVSNGKEAVEAFENENFDLILMDTQMPVMGGLEATKLIRSMEESSKQCVIIALTANVRSEDKSQAFDAGVNDYLTKPIDPPLFIRAIRKWLLKNQ